ncbi:hypothetical protein FVE85_4521 [Porphyridium purpureum]|uniref:Uncharacterized protein n=1 Tax=Porphyridium purpureum TaxID=35688 RepID=A0A5J4YK22_PORPP|nr:hypothetical protein FVE85_4521 [Porphyridium purpureum]|eukprot:POR4414..scf297_16
MGGAVSRPAHAAPSEVRAYPAGADGVLSAQERSARGARNEGKLPEEFVRLQAALASESDSPEHRTRQQRTREDVDTVGSDLGSHIDVDETIEELEDAAPATHVLHDLQNQRMEVASDEYPGKPAEFVKALKNKQKPFGELVSGAFGASTAHQNARISEDLVIGTLSRTSGNFNASINSIAHPLMSSSGRIAQEMVHPFQQNPLQPLQRLRDAPASAAAKAHPRASRGVSSARQRSGLFVKSPSDENVGFLQRIASKLGGGERSGVGAGSRLGRARSQEGRKKSLFGLNFASDSSAGEKRRELPTSYADDNDSDAEDYQVPLGEPAKLVREGRLDSEMEPSPSLTQEYIPQLTEEEKKKTMLDRLRAKNDSLEMLRSSKIEHAALPVDLSEVSAAAPAEAEANATEFAEQHKLDLGFSTAQIRKSYHMKKSDLNRAAADVAPEVAAEQERELQRGRSEIMIASLEAINVETMARKEDGENLPAKTDAEREHTALEARRGSPQNEPKSRVSSTSHIETAPELQASAVEAVMAMQRREDQQTKPKHNSAAQAPVPAVPTPKTAEQSAAAQESSLQERESAADSPRRATPGGSTATSDLVESSHFGTRQSVSDAEKPSLKRRRSGALPAGPLPTGPGEPQAMEAPRGKGRAESSSKQNETGGSLRCAKSSKKPPRLPTTTKVQKAPVPAVVDSMHDLDNLTGKINSIKTQATKLIQEASSLIDLVDLQTNNAGEDYESMRRSHSVKRASSAVSSDGRQALQLQAPNRNSAPLLSNLPDQVEAVASAPEAENKGPQCETLERGKSRFFKGMTQEQVAAADFEDILAFWAQKSNLLEQKSNMLARYDNGRGLDGVPSEPSSFAHVTNWDDFAAEDNSLMDLQEEMRELHAHNEKILRIAYGMMDSAGVLLRAVKEAEEGIIEVKTKVDVGAGSQEEDLLVRTERSLRESFDSAIRRVSEVEEEAKQPCSPMARKRLQHMEELKGFFKMLDYLEPQSNYLPEIVDSEIESDLGSESGENEIQPHSQSGSRRRSLSAEMLGRAPIRVWHSETGPMVCELDVQNLLELAALGSAGEFAKSRAPSGQDLRGILRQDTKGTERGDSKDEEAQETVTFNIPRNEIGKSGKGANRDQALAGRARSSVAVHGTYEPLEADERVTSRPGAVDPRRASLKIQKVFGGFAKLASRSVSTNEESAAFRNESEPAAGPRGSSLRSSRGIPSGAGGAGANAGPRSSRGLSGVRNVFARLGGSQKSSQKNLNVDA